MTDKFYKVTLIPTVKTVFIQKGGGTLLIGAMRFGGSPIVADPDAAGADGDYRKFVSSSGLHSSGLSYRRNFKQF
jgi:hypothetical protein